MDVKDLTSEVTLTRELKLDAAGIEQRKRLVGLAQADLDLIKLAKPAIDANLDALADSFFEFMRPMPEAQPLLGRPELFAEARRMKREHLQAMAAGEYGVSYATQRAKLGNLYAQVLLDPRLFLGAFHHLMRGAGQQIMRALQPAQGFDAFMAFKKVGFLDIGIIVDVLIAQRERLILQQQDSIRELSTPVLQIRDRMLLLPIIGVIDTHRARMITEGLLNAVRYNRAKVVVMDITGVATVDSRVANHILQTVAAARLMGAAVIVTGITADVAQSLVALGIDLGELSTVGDLQGGLEEAERMLGLRVVHGDPVPAHAGR